jgi:hypothetical protein
MKQELEKLSLSELRELREQKIADKVVCLSRANFSPNADKMRELAKNLTRKIHKIDRLIEEKE